MRDLVSVNAEIDSLWINVNEASRNIRRLEKLEDVMNTPLWKKIIFVLDGWPLFRLVDRPQWRPWRRWWRS